MKFIKAVEVPNGAHVTKKWRIETRVEDAIGDPEWDEPAGKFLGIVKWYPGWRRYSFCPEAKTLYEPTCLRDLADFCEGETKNRKAERAAELKGLAR